MNTAGWIVMLLSVGSVVSLVIFCLYRVLTLPPVSDDESEDDPDMESGTPTHGFD